MVFNDPVPERRNLLILTLLIHAWYIFDIQPTVIDGAAKASIFWGIATIRNPELIVNFLWAIYGWHLWQWACLEKCFGVIDGKKTALSFGEDLYYYRLDVINATNSKNKGIPENGGHTDNAARSALHIHILSSVKDLMIEYEKITANMKKGSILFDFSDGFSSSERDLSIDLVNIEERDAFWMRIISGDYNISVGLLEIASWPYAHMKELSRGFSNYSSMKLYRLYFGAKKELRLDDIKGTIYLQNKGDIDDESSFSIVITGKWPKSILRDCFYDVLLGGKYVSRIFIPSLIAMTALVWLLPVMNGG